MEIPEGPTGWRCGHFYPAMVEATGEGSRRARCLGCGKVGPTRAGAAEAMRALRDEGKVRNKIGTQHPPLAASPIRHRKSGIRKYGSP